MMREDIELVVANGGEHLCCHIGGIEAGLPELGEPGGQFACGTRRMGTVRLSVTVLPVTASLPDPRSHKTRTKHGDADAERRQLLCESFRDVDDGKLARRIGA